MFSIASSSPPPPPPNDVSRECTSAASCVITCRGQPYEIKFKHELAYTFWCKNKNALSMEHIHLTVSRISNYTMYIFHEIWYRSWRKVELHKNWLRSSQTLLKGVNEFLPIIYIFFYESEAGYTNHGGQVTQATKFCMAAPNVWQFSVCNLLYVTHLEHRIFRWFLHL